MTMTIVLNCDDGCDADDSLMLMMTVRCVRKMASTLNAGGYVQWMSYIRKDLLHEISHESVFAIDEYVNCEYIFYLYSYESIHRIHV